MRLEELGRQLAIARKRRRISQAELAAQFGMSRATISGLENGTLGDLGIRKVLMLCTALGLELQIQERQRRPTLAELEAELDES